MALVSSMPDFVPVSDWPSLHELCDGFDEHTFPDSSKLAGRTLKLVFDDDAHIDHSFQDDKILEWHITEGREHKGLSGVAQYRSFEVRPNIFFVDFYKPNYEEQVSIVLNLSTGQCLVAISGFEDKEGVRRTITKFLNAHVAGHTAAQAFEPTDELIGKHILYQYTGSDAYEHVYLNQGTFTWHCLSGTEKGLADTEPCKMLKLGEQLYLLFWTETIMPVESVVVVDLKQMRSLGRFFCWDPAPKKAVHTLFGSYATLLADTNANALVAAKK